MRIVGEQEPDATPPRQAKATPFPTVANAPKDADDASLIAVPAQAQARFVYHIRSKAPGAVPKPANSNVPRPDRVSPII